MESMGKRKNESKKLKSDFTLVRNWHKSVKVRSWELIAINPGQRCRCTNALGMIFSTNAQYILVQRDELTLLLGLLLFEVHLQ